ncbi:uncharacterized protein LOC131940867 [Physella acuta]|uniref:uncharacterized protein LOC131940867 n=1 Tax=Physella acuta TaxID=109671 RepID=UPI0027DD909E|nr:uncharacterized protein LOC131940867 [Physella acuta]
MSEFIQQKKQEYIDKNSSHENRFISVVTGRGLHSKDGIPKIKPAVEEYLDQHKYKCEWKSEGGMVVIDLECTLTEFEC